MNARLRSRRACWKILWTIDGLLRLWLSAPGIGGARPILGKLGTVPEELGPALGKAVMVLEDAGTLLENASPSLGKAGMVFGGTGMEPSLTRIRRSSERIRCSLTRIRRFLTRMAAHLTWITRSFERIMTSLTRTAFILTWIKNILIEATAIPHKRAGRETRSPMKRIEGCPGMKPLKARPVFP